MSLLEVQRRLVHLVNGNDEYPSSANLTPLESEWLNSLPRSTGLTVTRETQRWWRYARLYSSAPLSMRLLQRENRSQLIEEYMSTQPVRSLFFSAELEQLSAFLLSRSDVSDLVKIIASFEVALRNAHQLQNSCAHEHRYFLKNTLAFFKFPYPPDHLVSALLRDTPFRLGENMPVTILVSPAFPHLWRIASYGDEMELFQYNAIHNFR